MIVNSFTLIESNRTQLNGLVMQKSIKKKIILIQVNA